MSRFSFSLSAALMLAPLPAMAQTPAAVQAAQSPAMPGPAGKGNFAGKNRGGGLAGFLTPEQRSMYGLEMRDQVKSMTPDQRLAWRKEQSAKFKAMSDVDRQTFKMNLQTRWDALPPQQKSRIEQRLAARASRLGVQASQ